MTGLETCRANNQLALHVKDPEQAASFYLAEMGAKMVSRTPDCVELESGALRLFLVRDPEPSHEAVVPSFDVRNRSEALERLQAAGCTLVPIGPHAPAGQYVRDPFGVLFDLVEKRASGTVEIPARSAR